jgi:hypothetical protein
MKKYLEFLNENFTFKPNDKSPEIFQKTIYRLPTKDELENINSYNLSAQEIFNGFEYTIIGRGIKSLKNKNMIIESIKQLCELYPDNKNYEEALNLANNMSLKMF